MRVTVSADIRGKFLPRFKLVAVYQEIIGRRIDAIFQRGDRGALPRIDSLDKATAPRYPRPGRVGLPRRFPHSGPADR